MKVSSVNGNTTEEGKWMIIRFLVESKECLENISLVEVQQRDANTLLSLIAQYIRPGSLQ